jgi:hypothetical protein
MMFTTPEDRAAVLQDIRDGGSVPLGSAMLAACTDLHDFLETRGRYDHGPLLMHLAGRNGPRVRLVPIGHDVTAPLSRR